MFVVSVMTNEVLGVIEIISKTEDHNSNWLTLRLCLELGLEGERRENNE